MPSSKSKKRRSLFGALSSSKSPSAAAAVGEISGPIAVKHVTHVGWNANEGFNLNGLPDEWKVLFKAAGVRRRDLVDPESAKIIVFLPTARATQLYAAVWRALKPGLTRGAPGLELHSRKSQAARERAAALFQSAPPAGGPGAVLFTSDVSARGVDYAGVTCVVQVGGTRARATLSPECFAALNANRARRPINKQVGAPADAARPHRSLTPSPHLSPFAQRVATSRHKAPRFNQRPTSFGSAMPASDAGAGFVQ